MVHCEHDVCVQIHKNMKMAPPRFWNATRLVAYNTDGLISFLHLMLAMDWCCNLECDMRKSFIWRLVKMGATVDWNHIVHIIF